MGCLCSSEAQGKSSGIAKELRKQQKEEARIKKLLLLGAGGSGKSTFFKQLRILHGSGIQQTELENVYKDIVFSNVIVGMTKLLDAARELGDTNSDKKEDANYEVMKANEQHSKFISGFEEDTFAENRDAVAQAITALWKDPAIQAVWAKRAKFQIQDSAEYFFTNISRITEKGYVPNDEDVLLARIRTTGIVEQEFTVKGNKFQVFDVGGQRNERKKWIHCFEKVTGVIFLAALSAYDQTLYEDDSTNRMKEALDLFKQICNSRWFKETAMILFLNKKDLFSQKIKTTPLTVCFKEFSGNANDEIETREYIKEQFKKLNAPVKQTNGRSEKKPLFCHYTCAIDRNSMERIFRDVQNVIIHSNLKKAALI